MKSDLSSGFLLCGLYLIGLTAGRFFLGLILPESIWTIALPSAMGTALCAGANRVANAGRLRAGLGVLQRPGPGRLGSLAALGTSLLLFAAQSNLSEPLPVALREPMDLPGAIFSMVLLGPVCEEIVFRGMVQNAMGGDGRALGLQAALFAVCHLSLSGLPFAFLGGLTLGWLTLRTGGISTAVLAHAGANLLVILARFFVLSPPAWVLILCVIAGLFALLKRA